jgi:hypothetical protein
LQQLAALLTEVGFDQSGPVSEVNLGVVFNSTVLLTGSYVAQGKWFENFI